VAPVHLFYVPRQSPNPWYCFASLYSIKTHLLSVMPDNPVRRY
jgi:hypothetical protein